VSGGDLEITSRIENTNGAYCLRFDKNGKQARMCLKLFFVAFHVLFLFHFALFLAAISLSPTSGKLIEDSVTHQAMSRGTKVVAKALFQGLPVRRQVAKEDKSVTRRLNQVWTEGF
jgi:hypothetical protein